MLTSRDTLDRRARALGPDRTGRPGAEAAATLLAAAIAMGAYCLALAADRTYPFGRRSRAVNDLANQFVPFHAHLWDLTHGTSTGDLTFNWASGYGVPFLADFFTYLMNPFSWLVGLFPRDAVQAPVFLVTLLSIGLGSAAMTVYLGRLRPGPAWQRALLAAGYGVSTWTASDGFSDPMWMWVLVSLPVLGIAYEWCLYGRRWVPGALLVASCWAANFYTAAMATVGMGLVLLVRLALDPRPVRDRVRALLRAVTMTATGMVLVAPVLTVTYQASRTTQPPPGITYQGPPDPWTYLAHLLPGGLYPAAPRISDGVLPLVLVLTLPFMRRVPVRERILWPALLLLVALSYVWRPTILLWHGLALPNGSPYRAAVAMTAMLVVIAWLVLARRPGPGELLAGGATTAVLLALARPSSYLTGTDWLLAAVESSLVLGLLTLCHYRADRRIRAAIACTLAGSVLLTTAYSVNAVTRQRDGIAFWQPKRTIDRQTRAAAAAVRARDDWPASRTDPGPNGFADNDPLLLGGEGGSYYSSYVPEHSARTLLGLGAGWYWHGRHLVSFNDPVGRAIMGVSSYLNAAPDAANGFRQHLVAAPPLVTLHPVADFDAAAGTGSGLASGGGSGTGTVWARQQRVLGATVYRVPALIPTAGPRPTAGGGQWHLPGNAGDSRWTTFTAGCRPGSLVAVYAPWFDGRIRANGATIRQYADHHVTAAGIRTFGEVPADGRFTVALGTPGPQDIPRQAVGCLDSAALRRAVAGLRAGGPAAVTAGGHSIAADFGRATTGAAVVAVPAVTGWRCSVDGGAARPPRTLGGLIAVGLGADATRVACSYRTPGLRGGLLASGAGLLVLLAVAAAGSRRRAGTRWGRPG